MAYVSRLLPLLLAMSLSLPASAQINPFRGSRGTPLNADDLAALGDATTRLLDRQQLAVGNQETWSNPKSGINGVVAAGGAVKRNGLSCRVTNYVLTGPASEPQRKRQLTWCKTKDGWKIG